MPIDWSASNNLVIHLTNHRSFFTLLAGNQQRETNLKKLKNVKNHQTPSWKKERGSATTYFLSDKKEKIGWWLYRYVIL